MSRQRSERRKLGFEILEDRLVLAAAAADALDAAAWRQQAVAVDGAPVAVEAPAGEFPSADLVQSLRLIGVEQARARYPFTGAGYTVAIIDTGVDYNHPALGGGWGNRVIGGWDFVDDDGDPMDQHGHGTHVAGIVASSHSVYSGVAPEANLVALRVLNAQGSGNFGDVEDALRWVAAYAGHFNIVAATLSLGAGNYASNPYSFLEDELQQLNDRGVLVAAASGNGFYTEQSAPGLSYPAISTQTVSVGAVWDGDYGPVQWSSGAQDYSTAGSRIASFTQRNGQLSILAPGAFVTSTYLNGRYATMAGTSMATPVVAGAAVLVHQAFDATGRGYYGYRDALVGWLRDTGMVVVDGDDEDDNVINTGATFRRLDVLAVLDAIGRPAAQYADRADLAVIRQARWQFDTANNGHLPEQTLAYGFTWDTFVVGDANGDGRDEPGVFRDGLWHLDLAGDGHLPERIVAFGLPTDRPVIGDFDGDGRDDLAVFRGGVWGLDLAGDGHLAERVVAYGRPDDVPLVGDWDGDGRDDLGIFRNGSWQLDVAGDGHLPEWVFEFGAAGDLPVVGDWDGNGRDDPGVFRNGVWYLAPGNGAVLMFRYGQAGDVPVSLQRFGGSAAMAAAAGVPSMTSATVALSTAATPSNLAVHETLPTDQAERFAANVPVDRVAVDRRLSMEIVMRGESVAARLAAKPFEPAPDEAEPTARQDRGGSRLWRDAVDTWLQAADELWPYSV